MKLTLKICGLRDKNNILNVCDLNPDLLGFIFYPSSKRYVGDHFDPAILQLIPSRIGKVAVFVDESMERVKTNLLNYKFTHVQLHGKETPEYCLSLKKEVDITIIKAFGIHQDFDWNKTAMYQACCDYLLFDTSTKDHGGSGLKFDWKILNDYQGSTPFFLSGGIGPEDFPAIQNIKHPLFKGVDINSQFEISPGLKDLAKLKHFTQQLNASSYETSM